MVYYIKNKETNKPIRLLDKTIEEVNDIKDATLVSGPILGLKRLQLEFIRLNLSRDKYKIVGNPNLTIE